MKILFERDQRVSKILLCLQLWEVSSARGTWTPRGSGTMVSTVLENRPKNNSVAALPLSSIAARRESRWSLRMPPGKASSAATTMDRDCRAVW
jgi:hypothetical protein